MLHFYDKEKKWDINDVFYLELWIIPIDNLMTPLNKYKQENNNPFVIAGIENRNIKINLKTMKHREGKYR